ncbi:MAG: hypothetical protein GX793_00280 [Bacteroidales bacterium]|jgi:hypothetical protein|nr:hypothetical protein [Bacteroidales bacterium]MCK9498013.1 hypothetical protein [Bacteroidales bacterium]MDY0314219.1 hypothetical protein [Bacteroidales bacterium]NLB85477.1 hypothetical protein [Bacteroidales bacterium]
MKKIFSLLFLFAVSYSIYAQPTEAVDFTVIDIDGVEHNLFTYLDAGKYVYIDFLLEG